MPLPLILSAVAVGLLAVAVWWIRRNRVEVEVVRGASLLQAPPSTGCDDCPALLMASVVDTATTPSGSTSAKTAPSPAPAPPKAPPKRKKPSGPSRRNFLRNAWLTAWGGVVAAFTGASIAFLWPTRSGGGGAQLEVGTVDEVAQLIADGGGFHPITEASVYLVSYDKALDSTQQYLDITDDGNAPFMALYWKCVHLQCRVPWCASSEWFECPCHGSRYNRWGEYQFGPAPRGLDRYKVMVQDGTVFVDRSQLVTGPTRQGASLDQPPAGPHCN